jgi:hypothetical protein
MPRLLIATTIAFALGIGVGSLAFGQRVEGTPEPVTADVPSAGSGPSMSRPEHPAGPASAELPTEVVIPVETPVDGVVSEIELGPADAAERRMLAIETRWSGLSTKVERLSRRVIDLERQLAERTGGADGGDDDGRPEALPTDTPEDRQRALELAGVDRRIAQDIVVRESELAMERLDLRDRAAREGWLGSDRFVEEMRDLNERALDLRSEVGDTAFDRFLYETGQSNRIAVTSVLAGSQGELAGILPGDIIEDYAGERVFDFSDLRNATTSGTRDETVPVTLRRDGRLIETWMARGPIGVTLQADSTDPDW